MVLPRAGSRGPSQPSKGQRRLPWDHGRGFGNFCQRSVRGLAWGVLGSRRGSRGPKAPKHRRRGPQRTGGTRRPESECVGGESASLPCGWHIRAHPLWARGPKGWQCVWRRSVQVGRWEVRGLALRAGGLAVSFWGLALRAGGLAVSFWGLALRAGGLAVSLPLRGALGSAFGTFQTRFWHRERGVWAWGVESS
jgi:hypothetical protein